MRFATAILLVATLAACDRQTSQEKAHEDERALLTALAGLDARERDVLGLKFAARLTNREIARNLGLRESHVGVIVYRALGKLRMVLGKE